MSERTTLYLRGVPKRLVREAKAAAARQGATLAALVCESLTKSLEDGAAAPTTSGLHESRQWYERNRERLAARYRGQYIAVVDRAVVDHDRDFSALATRTLAKLGDRPVFMPRVSEEDRALRLRSPRRVRA